MELSGLANASPSLWALWGGRSWINMAMDENFWCEHVKSSVWFKGSSPSPSEPPGGACSTLPEGGCGNLIWKIRAYSNEVTFSIPVSKTNHPSPGLLCANAFGALGVDRQVNSTSAINGQVRLACGAFPRDVFRLPNHVGRQ